MHNELEKTTESEKLFADFKQLSAMLLTELGDIEAMIGPQVPHFSSLVSFVEDAPYFIDSMKQSTRDLSSLRAEGLGGGDSLYYLERGLKNHYDQLKVVSEICSNLRAAGTPALDLETFGQSCDSLATWLQKNYLGINTQSYPIARVTHRDGDRAAQNVGSGQGGYRGSLEDLLQASE